MLRIAIISFLVSAALAQWTPTEEDLRKMSEFSRTLNNKVKVNRETPITLHVGSSCIQDSDCPSNFSCFNIADALFDFLFNTSHLNEFEFLSKKARISVKGKECVVESSTLFQYFTAEEYTDRAISLVARINEILLGKKGLCTWGYDMEQLNIKLPNVTEIRKLMQEFNLTELRKPRTRQSFGQSAGIPLETLFLLLALRGSGTGTGGLDNNLLILLLLSGQGGLGGQGGGIDNNFLSNPFLLFLLLGNDNSNTNSNNNNLLLFSLLLSPNGGLGGTGGVPSTASTGLGLGQDTLFSNPLILFTLLGDSGSGSSSLNDLLPILLLSGGGLGGDPNNPSGGLTSILPLLLLTNSSLFGSSGSGTDNLLPLLLLSGGLGGSDPNGGLGGGGGLESILPLLLLTNSGSGSSSINDLLPILLLSGGGLGGDPNNPSGGLTSILPLLLLTNSSLFGSSSGSGSDNNLLLLLLLSGGLGGSGGLGDPNSQSGFGGGLGSILPLLLLTNSSLFGGSGGSSIDSLLPILLLSGGLGGGTGSGIESLLPFLLLNNNSGSNDNTLLLLIILLSFNQPAPTQVFPQQPIITVG